MPLTRRELFTLGWGARRTAGRLPPLPVAPPAPVFLRPPGALPEAEFLEACTRCDACLVACPRESIRRAGPELGDRNEGTPAILPALAPCWLCKDLPCITACPTGALRPLEAPRDARLGSIEVRARDCFSAQGNPCDVCVERCPVRPRAVRVSPGTSPEVDPGLCTGCAVCAWLCPAQAIDVEPRGSA